MNKKLSRRDLLKAALLVTGGSAVVFAQQLIGDTVTTASVLGQTDNRTYLAMVRNVIPTPTRTPAPVSRPKVVYVHSINATTSFTSPSDYFWQHVNQGTIDTMVDQGVMNLTGSGTVADAWGAIMTGYLTIDSIMADYLDYEASLSGGATFSDDFLTLAEQAGLGVAERANPWTNNYTKILLNKIEV